MYERVVTDGPGNVRELQTLVERIWTPASTYHIGDLAWERYHLPDREDLWTTAVWRNGVEVLAWAQVHDHGALRLLVDPDWPDLAEEVAHWVVETAGSRALAATVSESETSLLAALRAEGFADQDNAPFFLRMTRSLEHLPAISGRPGVIFRPSRGLSDLDRLLQGHREAWDGSRVSRDSLRAVMLAWPYDPCWHWLAEDAEGQVLSQAICWWDAKNLVGEFEPVGTHREHRGQGLVSVVMLHVLHQLKASGAKLAVVSARGDDGYPVPRHVYATLGFSAVARTRTLVRPPTQVHREKPTRKPDANEGFPDTLSVVTRLGGGTEAVPDD